MLASSHAPSILSQFGVWGMDAGQAVPAAARDAVASDRGGVRIVTLIVEGVVARRRPGDGVALGMAGPGEMIGFEPGGRDGEAGLWLSAGQKIEIPQYRMIEALGPVAVAELAVEDLRSKVRTAHEEIARHARLRVTERLAALLWDIQDRSGETTIALRQSDLAELLAVRRAGVSGACSELRAAGAARVRRGAVELLDLQALGRAARLTPP
jgi:CRP-like cAMP-binding protein